MTTKPTSASNASHSSAETDSTTSCSELASLTIAMISARREASTKRRRIASWSSRPVSADCDNHHGMVPVSLCATHATYFAVRVEPRQGWRRVTERLDQRGRLALQRLAVHRERALAAGTVED